MTRRERDHLRTLRARREILQARIETTRSRSAVLHMEHERDAIDWALLKLYEAGYK